MTLTPVEAASLLVLTTDDPALKRQYLTDLYRAIYAELVAAGRITQQMADFFVKRRISGLAGEWE